MYIIRLQGGDEAVRRRQDEALKQALVGHKYIRTETPEELQDLTGRLEGSACLFVIALDAGGYNEAYRKLVAALYKNKTLLADVRGGILIDGPDELFTKKTARELLFIANRAGCIFPGTPLVEGTGSLYNFTVRARIRKVSKKEAYILAVCDLVEKLSGPLPQQPETTRLLVVHASRHSTSNTLLLWEMVKKNLTAATCVEEISLLDGELIDCRGCAYEMCLHYGEQSACFYGGHMVESVYPALKRCNALLLACPNYNDAVGANMAAFFNRLTALFRSEYDNFAVKRLYALVVSGYSGGDIVAEQIASTMCLNKNFMLPPYFALVETAHEPKSILACEKIEEKARLMASHIEGKYK